MFVLTLLYPQNNKTEKCTGKYTTHNIQYLYFFSLSQRGVSVQWVITVAAAVSVPIPASQIRFPCATTPFVKSTSLPLRGCKQKQRMHASHTPTRAISSPPPSTLRPTLAVQQADALAGAVG